jgi:acyl phosphate:glycerol-3-phosphate acyltransferase
LNFEFFAGNQYSCAVDILVWLTTAVIAYLLGSIPTGYLVGMAKGIDVRTVGSGNIGATNAFRVLGTKAGILVLVIDALKGWLAVAVAPVVIHDLVAPSSPWDQSTRDYLQITAGVVAILGHNYTCWLHFKGGKGIATTAGVLCALMPLTFAIALASWIIACLLTRYVSVASITAAVMLPIATLGVHFFTRFEGYSYRMIIVATVLGLLAIFKHKANIERLMNGTESRIGSRKSAPTVGGAQ